MRPGSESGASAGKWAPRLPQVNTNTLPALMGWIIRDRRTAMNLTLVEVSTRAGVSRSSLSRWELGEATPSVMALYALGEALNCHPAVLLPPPVMFPATRSR